MAQDRQQQSETPIKAQGRTISHDNRIHATSNIATANVQKPPPATSQALQGFSNKILKDPCPTSNNIQYLQREKKTMDAKLQSQSQSQLEEALWKVENASLEDEFSALENILGSYMELQTRIFHDLGGEDDNNHGNEMSTSTSRSSSISTASAASKSCRRADFGHGTATDAAEVAAAVATVEYDQRGLVLSDAVRYIHYLEALRDNFASEKAVLESKVSGWEELGLKVMRRPEECGAE